MNFFYRGHIPRSIKILLSVHLPHLSRVLKIWDSVAVVVVVVVVVMVVVVAVAVVVVVLVDVALVEVVVVVVVVIVMVEKLLYFHDRIIIQYCKSMDMTIKI